MTSNTAVNLEGGGDYQKLPRGIQRGAAKEYCLCIDIFINEYHILQHGSVLLRNQVLRKHPFC